MSCYGTNTKYILIIYRVKSLPQSMLRCCNCVWILRKVSRYFLGPNPGRTFEISILHFKKRGRSLPSNVPLYFYHVRDVNLILQSLRPRSQMVGLRIFFVVSREDQAREATYSVLKKQREKCSSCTACALPFFQVFKIGNSIITKQNYIIYL